MQVTEHTNLYTSQNNNHIFRVTNDEIYVFDAILHLSEYRKLPIERNYWCLDEDLLFPSVEIKKYFNNCQLMKQ